ncbi:MAG: EAL domain-containing protein [Acidihalobacter sp.]|uniref:EAL domain-containing protein n=1 Tax=Acidihalobacter sp. TaxID=1872108 RepID=UPI00307E1303
MPRPAESGDAADGGQRLAELQAELFEIALSGASNEARTDAMCRIVEAALPQTIAAVALPDAQGRLRLSAPSGVADADTEGTFPLEPLFAADACNDARCLELRPLFERLGIAACWLLPLAVRGERTPGFFLLASFTPRASTEFDRSLQRCLAAALVLVLDERSDSDCSRLRSVVLDSIDVGMMVLATDGCVLYANRAFGSLLGRDSKSLQGGLYLLLRDGGATDADLECLREAHARGVSTERELYLHRADGLMFWACLTLRPVDGIDPGERCWLVVLDDIDARKSAEESLLRQKRLYRALIKGGNLLLRSGSDDELLRKTCRNLIRGTPFHAVWIVRPDTQGYFSVLASAGRGARSLQSLRVNVQDVALSSRAFRTGQRKYTNDSLKSAQGAAWIGFFERNRWHSVLAMSLLRQGRVWAVLGMAAPQRGVFDQETRDLCQQIAELLGRRMDELDLKQRLSTLRELEAERARLDVLTGLPNRYALEQHLPRAIARARRHGTEFAVGVMDLDDFKPVNDRWGHPLGDELLKQLAGRLRGVLRESDFLARLGGDEFVLVFEDLDELQVIVQLRGVLDRLHTVVETPFELGGGRQAMIDMSMGLALFPLDADEPDGLIRFADAAMYQAKQRKGARRHWWRLGTTEARLPEVEPPIAPYGEVADELLVGHQSLFAEIAGTFVKDFYAGLDYDPASRVILSMLAPAELQQLKSKQIEYMKFLMRPGQSLETQRERAWSIGKVHALAGVDNVVLIASYDLYKRLLSEHLNRAPLRPSERYRLLLIAGERLQDALQGELKALEAVDTELLSVLAAPLSKSGTRWPDAVESELSKLGALLGIRAVVLMRPDAEGVFTIEAHAGREGERVAGLLHTPELQLLTDASDPRGRGLSARTWRMLEIQRVSAFLTDPRQRLWCKYADELGIRSAMAVPVRNERGHGVLVLTLYGAYPHQFDRPVMRQWAGNLQQRWEWLLHQVRRPVPVVSGDQAAHWRVRLFSGGFDLRVQPIVDLNSGRVNKAEALARLVLEDGREIPPDRFLPLLGDAELYRLFRMGLERVLDWFQQWEADGVTVSVSLNLPPNILVEPDIAASIAQALRRRGLEPQRLILELLETEILDQTEQEQALERLKAIGVRLAMDDLGAGYSSLLRLIKQPLDTLKIDQNLVSRLLLDPLPTLTLLWTLIRLSEDLKRELVVEGLSSMELVEVMRCLGVPQGQGFALARPMPAAAFPCWLEGFTLPPSTYAVSSYIGALAYHWRWLHAPKEPVPADACPVAAFLLERGHAGDVAMSWHAHIHAGENVELNAGRFNVWLAERVTEQAIQHRPAGHPL